MAVLPGVLECRFLRRTIQVRLKTNTLRLPGGTPILFALAALRSVPQAGSQFRGLSTATHELSGLKDLRLQFGTAHISDFGLRIVDMRCGIAEFTDTRYLITSA